MTKNGAELKLKPIKTTKHGNFLCFSIKQHPKLSNLTQKTQNFEKNFLRFLGPHASPLGVPISQLLGQLSKIASMSPLI